MSKLADMAIDLLCTLTFSPEGGHDPDDLADIERVWWQTLLHDLDSEEKEDARQAVQRQLESFRSSPSQSFPEHVRTQIDTLEAYLRGELQ